MNSGFKGCIWSLGFVDFWIHEIEDKVYENLMDFKISSNITEKGKRQRPGSNKNTVVSCHMIFPLDSK